MTKREKVIRGLELCAYDPDPGQELKEVRSCPECPYYRAGCSPQLIRDALALLKEQEARVMTENEVECDCPDCVYFETRTGWLECAIKDEGESDRYFGVFVYGCNEWFMRSYEEYGKTWRCWTSRPTPEQMRDTKWEDEAE